MNEIFSSTSSSSNKPNKNIKETNLPKVVAGLLVVAGSLGLIGALAVVAELATSGALSSFFAITLPLAVVNPIFAALLGGGALLLLMIGLIIFLKIPKAEDIFSERSGEASGENIGVVQAQFNYRLLDPNEDIFKLLEEIAKGKARVGGLSLSYKELMDVLNRLNDPSARRNSSGLQPKELCFYVSDMQEGSVAFFVKEREGAPSCRLYVFEPSSKEFINIIAYGKNSTGKDRLKLSNIDDYLSAKLQNSAFVYFL